MRCFTKKWSLLFQDGFAAPEDGEVPVAPNGDGEELDEY